MLISTLKPLRCLAVKKPLEHFPNYLAMESFHAEYAINIPLD